MVKPIRLVTATEEKQVRVEEDAATPEKRIPSERSKSRSISPKPTTSRGSSRAQKRKTSYKELSTSTSDSEESVTSRYDATADKKKVNKNKKTTAKDGRKLIDLTGRERPERPIRGI